MRNDEPAQARIACIFAERTNPAHQKDLSKKGQHCQIGGRIIAERAGPPCRLHQFLKDREVPMKTAIVIPARYASQPPARQAAAATNGEIPHPARLRTRLPMPAAEPVVVATDDPRIVAAVESFGGPSC